ncbi:Gfo/Idh/MocA family protein [Tomitella biformata]|uniref:Gfo/Idh/MocA family protein n=1 Tax=Tomitella biformata TaxID=630403 RepID=UPI0004649C99|nr:Gfo/Idh/MocA family oxidoreductase [Tomitella biformata]
MTVRVGVVGLSAGGSWASFAHLPALRAAEGFEVRALATSSPESAKAAAEAYGVPLAFSSVEELARSEEVDLVVVAVKVPDHREIVLKALAADKPVLCEWPLANGVAEAEELASAAEGKRVYVGFQSTAAPAVRYLRDLIADGFVGEVTSTSLIATGGPWGGPVGNRTEYLLDKTHGATMMTIIFGHLVDAFSYIVGDLVEVNATTAVRNPMVLNTDSGELVPATAEDDIAVTGTLASGAIASLHLRGANAHSSKMVWEINGTQGHLRIDGSGATLANPMKIQGARGDDAMSEMPVPASYDSHADLTGSPAHAMAHAYDRIREDLTGDAAQAPDFAHARQRHLLLDAIERAAETGARQSVPAK